MDGWIVYCVQQLYATIFSDNTIIMIIINTYGNGKQGRRGWRVGISYEQVALHS